MNSWNAKAVSDATGVDGVSLVTGTEVRHVTIGTDIGIIFAVGNLGLKAHSKLVPVIISLIAAVGRISVYDAEPPSTNQHFVFKRKVLQMASSQLPFTK